MPFITGHDREAFQQLASDHVESWNELCRMVSGTDRLARVISESGWFKYNISLYTNPKVTGYTLDDVRLAMLFIHQTVGTKRFEHLLKHHPAMRETVCAIANNLTQICYVYLDPALFILKFLIAHLAACDGPKTFTKSIDTSLSYLGYNHATFSGMSAVYLHELQNSNITIH